VPRINYTLVILVAVKILLHLFTSTNYGFHRDELLYLAVGQRLNVFANEFPPLIAIFGYILQSLFGESLFAVRLLPALAGGAIVLFTGLTVRELGGGRFAQAFAGLVILIVPVYLRAGTLFQPVVFEQFLWTLACYLVVLIVRKDAYKLWYILGVVVGLGLLNRFTILVFTFGLFAGLIFTSHRRFFQRKEPWIAAFIASIVGLPAITGQIVNGWPLFTHVEYITATQFGHAGISDFLIGQILMLHPITLPVWIAGLSYFLFHPTGRLFRLFALCYFVVLLLFLSIGGKAYYLAPMYPVIIAGGALFIESVTGDRRRWVKQAAILAIIFLCGLYLLPVGVPLLHPGKLERYIKIAGLEEVNKTNRGEYGRIPQDFADMFGWEEQVEEVAQIYYGLAPEERARAIIITNNYGRAGAIDLFGKRHNLPRAVSYVSSYHAWGPGETSAEIAIAVGIPVTHLEILYEEIEHVAILHHEFAVAEEQNVPVYLCRSPKKDLPTIWPDLKRP
jgi:hypothetical protein